MNAVILPRARYRTGPHWLRPIRLGVGVSAFTFVMDKTRWDSPARTAAVLFDLSFDDGRTWQESDPFPCGFTAEGGGVDVFGHRRVSVAFSPWSVPQPLNGRRVLRGRMRVAGGAIETEGTLLLAQALEMATPAAPWVKAA